MKSGVRRWVFPCIVLFVAIIACQLSPFGKDVEKQIDNENIDDPKNNEGVETVIKTLLPEGVTSLLPNDNDKPFEGVLKPQGFELVGQLGGSAMDIFVKDKIAVMGQGPRVVTLDVSNPASPVLLGESEVLSGWVLGVEVAGDYAFATSMYGGLNILSISNPEKPELVSTAVPKVPGCDGITLDENVAYMACNPGGLFIVNIENPKKPQILYQSEKPTGAVFSITKIDDYVYMTDTTTMGFYIFNVKNPGQPIEEDDFLYSDIPGAESQGGYISSVSGCGEFLCAGTFQDGLVVLELDNPAEPKVIGQVGNILIDGMVVHGNTVFTADAIDGIAVIDISDPENPVKTGLRPTNVGGWELTVTEHAERGMFIADDRLYITDQAFGMTIADISNPATPSRMGNYMTPVPHILFNIKLNGDNAILMGNNSGLRSVDISDPSNPIELAYDDERKDIYLQTPSGLEIRDNFAYISDRNYPFHLYDISDPANPIQTGSVSDFAASDGAFDIVLYKNFAYLSGWGLKDAFYPGNGIWVIDISDPANPAAVNFIDTANERWLLTISNEYLFALDTGIDEKQPEPLSLRVLDLKNPGSPLETTSIHVPEAQNLMEKDMLIDEERLYISLPMVGVLVYDISEPAQPERIGNIPIMVGMTDMIKNEQYLILSGATAYDISNIQNPEFAGTTGILQAWDFAIKEDLVFVATTYQGLYIFKFDPIQ